MAHEEQGPAGGVTAHLTIRDKRAAEAVEFYKAAFGAETAMDPVKADDGERIMHAHLLLNGGHLMLNDDFPEYSGGETAPGSLTLHLQVMDADAAWARAVDAGAEIVLPLDDQFWGDRYGQVRDPFGFRWSIGAPVKA
ncbi:glyoxalase/bleomycin resistance/extradiol dioxygenase family protein [Sphingosinicella sp. LHD-64]|uniref:VOC family protein n=1 Tax=Sphingosinicella sp. LHD-64 TaxID=3072139 RepID=UPI00280DFF76|nr:glyoxalase/bleomycin resistance/extradiol dioxygenase family protein [Sphingosinicella sp. LHD-64]MDQ8755864.1 glyoxalase/bleomycin resistance/extradiol dioxygenase family protein [Sphingosinicella sp. LHD-64]